MGVHPLQEVSGVPESVLADADAARLPAGSAPAPWETVLDAVVWLHRAAPGAQERLPRELRGRPTLPVTAGALVSYRETPVGPYREVLGTPVLLVESPLPESAAVAAWNPDEACAERLSRLRDRQVLDAAGFLLHEEDPALV